MVKVMGLYGRTYVY
uniref:Uncharacterized protein n=1 Tax=Lepeophtheirus salmonis TaxID=72036 RepID=A0A0K2TS20_LEPSM